MATTPNCDSWRKLDPAAQAQAGSDAAGRVLRTGRQQAANPVCLPWIYCKAGSWLDRAD